MVPGTDPGVHDHQMGLAAVAVHRRCRRKPVEVAPALQGFGVIQRGAQLLGEPGVEHPSAQGDPSDLMTIPADPSMLSLRPDRVVLTVFEGFARLHGRPGVLAGQQPGQPKLEQAAAQALGQRIGQRQPHAAWLAAPHLGHPTDRPSPQPERDLDSRAHRRQLAADVPQSQPPRGKISQPRGLHPVRPAQAHGGRVSDPHPRGTTAVESTLGPRTSALLQRRAHQWRSSTGTGAC